MQLVGSEIDIVIGLCEDKRIGLRPVDEHAVLTGRVVVTDGVELPVEACIEDGVHEQVMDGVHLRGDNITKFPVYRPHIDTFGYLLMAYGIVIVLVEVPVVGLVPELITLDDRSVLVNLVIRLRLSANGEQAHSHHKE